MSDCNELFEAILDRFFIICDNQCDGCPVMKLRRENSSEEPFQTSCWTTLAWHQVEAAHLFGIDPEHPRAWKPNRAWTAEGISRYCKSFSKCSIRCRFFEKKRGVCSLTSGARPDQWDMQDGPQFSEKDVEIAKEYLAKYSYAKSIIRKFDGSLHIRGNLTLFCIDAELFKNVFPGEAVSIFDVIGEGQDDKADSV